MSLGDTILCGDGLLAKVSGDPLLFVPQRQQLLSVTPLVASLWADLEIGLTAHDLEARACELGGEGSSVIAELEESGAIFRLEPEDFGVTVLSRQFFEIGGFKVGLSFTGPKAAAMAAAMFSHAAVAPTACDLQIIVVEETDRVGIASAGELLEWFDWDGFCPALKIGVTEFLLANLEVPALHAATLRDTDQALLILGDPGEGKSTLGVALDAAGFTLLGDDLACLEPDGTVRPLSFPLTLKDGSWPLVEEFRDDLAAAPIFERPDGKIVRYLPLARAIDARALPVRCVIILDRHESNTSGLEEIRSVDVLSSFIGSLWSADRKLSPSGFGSIVDCINGARFFRMSFRELQDAIPLVREAWVSTRLTETGV